MNPYVALAIGIFTGGFFGLLVAALASAAKRADELEDILHGQHAEEDAPSGGIYILEPREPLDEDTTRQIAESFETQVPGSRVIILDAYRVDEPEDEQ